MSSNIPRPKERRASATAAGRKFFPRQRITYFRYPEKRARKSKSESNRESNITT